MKKILMTGAGAPGGPGIIKCLLQGEEHSLIAADINPNASGSFLNNEFIQIPSAKDETFIPFILDFCLNNKVDIIFPLVTKELIIFAQNKDVFDQHGIKVLVSDYHSLSIANDKGKLLQHLSQNNIPTPQFQIVKNETELKEAVLNLGYPEKPVVIKPCSSNGSRGVRILDESIDHYDLLFNQKPSELYSTLEHILETLNGRSFPDLLVSEHLPGPEYTIDCIVQNGEINVILPRKRVKINNGISVAGSFENHEEIINYSKQIIGSLDLTGPIGIQVKQASNGKFLVLEINPRIQGSSSAALGAGVNLPSLAVQTLSNAPLPTVNINWDCQFYRYYDEVFKYSKS